jgi:16S rRNA G966 N2-methylase RsmD
MRDELIKKRGYDAAIQGDDLSLKISSYPVAARYLAKRLSHKGKTLCELCCGVGVCTVEFSRYFAKVIGIDNDTAVLDCARQNVLNASSGNCEFILGDITDLRLLEGLHADIAVYDIPYWSDHDNAMIEKNPKLDQVVKNIKKCITTDIVIYTPPTVQIDAIAPIATSFEYQQVFIDGRYDRNYVYLGSLIEKQGATKIDLATG